MAERLQVPKADVLYHPNGITLQGYDPPSDPPAVSTLGYFARLCPLKGLDQLVDAFLELKELDKFSNLRLEIAGGMTAEDEPYVEEQRRKLVQAGLADHFSIRSNINRSQKLEFLKNLTIFSVPARYPEAFGLYVVEAMAAGVPVVLPDCGAFPEIVNTTKGGSLYDPDQPGALTDTLDRMLSDRAKAHEIGRLAHDAVSRYYANEVLAPSFVEKILSPLNASVL
jgi:glycosyltransferase involved in cell wall biosynthesis